MQISERRTTLRYACDGVCEGVPQVLVVPPGTKPTFYMEASRYKVMFWWMGPDGRSGCRVEVLGRRIKVDGSLSRTAAARIWDLEAGRRADIPDWLRLVVEVDLYKMLPDWAASLWAANCSGLTEVGA